MVVAEIQTKKKGHKIIVERGDWKNTPMGNIREWIYCEELEKWLPSKTVGMNLPIWLWEKIVEHLPAMLGRDTQGAAE